MVVFCDRLPHPGETVLGGKFHMFGGGKGANQAVAAARAGGAVTFLGAYGADTSGPTPESVWSRRGSMSITLSACKVRQAVSR